MRIAANYLKGVCNKIARNIYEVRGVFLMISKLHFRKKAGCLNNSHFVGNIIQNKNSKATFNCMIKLVAKFFGLFL